MIQFEHLVIHNFNSYSHSEFDLRNKGFCFISGQNNYTKDCSKSNGAGKSTFLNAISVCLTGETLNGLKSGFKNLLVDEDSCYITLSFKYNNDSYIITRQFNPKSDLKIIKNSEDISGKGITDSKKVLNDVLPDLNKDLLASTIIIGQGMPNRLTLNSPSGRKDLLESLTKTDFMIEDTRSRLDIRLNQISNKIRETQDALLVKETKLSTAESSLEKLVTEIKLINKPDENEINTLKSNLINSNTIIQDLTEKITKAEKDLKVESDNYLSLIEQKNSSINQLNEEFNTRTSELKEKRVLLNSQISNLKSQIKKIESMSDTCPTCGQKLLNFTRPSVENEKKELKDLSKELDDLELSLKSFDEKYLQFKTQIENSFSSDLEKNKVQKTLLEESLSNSRQQLKTQNLENSFLQIKINLLEKDLLNFEKNLSEKNKSIEETKKEIQKIKNDIEKLTETKIDLEQRLAVLKKMESLAKRDFRGILLQNIIKYLNAKSKEFCKIVFNTDEINIFLDGNNLDVSYCGKLVEGLSGGERTKVDLIVQLALRDLLIKYFGMNSNILALDEVTDYLDSTGCENIVKLIQSELTDVESVFIISHRQDELDLPVDSYINIVKDTNGISSVC